MDLVTPSEEEGGNLWLLCVWTTVFPEVFLGQGRIAVLLLPQSLPLA
jgi:hypothetical protein